MYDTSNIDGLTDEKAEIKGDRFYYRSEKTETEIEDGDNLRRYDIKLTYNGLTVEARRITGLEVEWSNDWKWMRFKEEDETVFTIGIGYGEKGEEDTTIAVHGETMKHRIRNVDYDTAMRVRLEDLVEYEDKTEA